MPECKKILKKALAVFACLISLFAIYALWELVKAYGYSPVSESVLAGIDSNSARKLMIVAHPDDESIWGGGHLADGGYLVVCITNGRHETRRAEFERAMKISQNQYLILDYPDKTFDRRDDWSACGDAIAKDLKKIMEYCDWDLVVTHNPEGEYGHEHHIMTNIMVTQIYEESELSGTLYFFGKYYSKSAFSVLEHKPEELDGQALDFKQKKLLAVYDSQKKVISNIGYILPYEDWTLYKTASQQE